MLRGYNPNPITFAVGIAFLRFGFTLWTYSETKGLIDPFLVCVGMWMGRVTWKYGLVLIAAQIGGSAAGIGMVHAFNPAGSGLIISDGAPLIGAAWIPYATSLALTFEFLGTLFGYMAVLYSFGLRKVHCFYKRLAKMELASNKLSFSERQLMEAWKTHGHAMEHMSPGKLGGALTVGAVYGVVSAIGYSITGAGLDFFMFLWSASYSGLFTAGYANWWIYLVGPAIAAVGGSLFFSLTLRGMHGRYETMKARMLRHTQYIVTIVPPVQVVEEADLEEGTAGN